MDALDKVFGGLLLAATPGVPDLLSIFDAKSELTRVGSELVARGIDRRHGLGQVDRVQRLRAARGVLVVTAFFEAVAELSRSVQAEVPVLSRREQLGLAAESSAESLKQVAEVILGSRLPELGVQAAPAETRAALQEFYGGLNERFLDFVRGLSWWEELGPLRRQALSDALARTPLVAVDRFEGSLVRAAAECPEFSIWLSLSENRATHERVRDVQRAVSQLLDRAQPVERAAPAFQGVLRSNRAVLGRKLVKADDLPEGLDAPTVEDAYVDPMFKLAKAGALTSISSEDFWDRVPPRAGFSAFFLAHLSTPAAWEAPLVVLGHPGAGKSLLTEVQAATLPSPDFVVVRVPLRDVRAEAEVHDQVEQAIRLSTHESVSWPEFARAAGESVLLLFLDGFDELIQATGVSKSDYLVRVQRFQEVERTQGRHVGVVVTSRVTVADRMRLPGEVLVARIERFEVDQIQSWVDVWNYTNRDYLRANGRSPLTLETIERHLDLVSQPLLLLMVALYDAESGALQGETDKLSKSELYERLLVRFARREVSKRVDPEDDAEVEKELLILSVVAIGMFNRGAQWITDEELAADLVALGLAGDSRPAVTAAHQRLAGQARDALGRFFYIHRARATVDDQEIGTYEFLHATFGEYLVARLTWRCVVDLVERIRVARSALFADNGHVDDARLRGFLSCSVLSVRTTTMEFLVEEAARTPGEQLRAMREALLAAFRALQQPGREVPQDAYQPVAMTQVERAATYSANLVLLLTVVADGVSSADLFPEDDLHGERWSRLARLWQSQLSGSAWHSVVEAFAVRRGGPAGKVLVHSRGREWVPASEATFFRAARLIAAPELDHVVSAIGGPTGFFARTLPYTVFTETGAKPVVAELLAAFLFHARGRRWEERRPVYLRLVNFAAPVASEHAALVFQLLVNDELVPESFLREHLHEVDLPMLGQRVRNLGLYLKLLDREGGREHALEALNATLQEGVSLEQAAEIWCALADRRIPVADYTEALGDYAHDLRWPQRDTALAHRPDLLSRLSALEDDELL
nr:hypothetical protein [Actinokineospora bangkokensis]